MADNFYSKYEANTPSVVVTTINSLSGAVTLAAGTGISITPSGQTLTIASTVSGGANTTLSNLTSPTAINQDLLMTASKIIRMANNSAIKARNALDNADITMMKLNAVNEIEIGLASQVLLLDTSGNTSVNVTPRYLNDSSNVTAVEWNARRLDDTNGDTLAEWSSPNYLAVKTDIQIGNYTSNFVAIQGSGVTIPQSGANGALQFLTQDHANNSTNLGKEIDIVTGDKLGASSTNDSGKIYISTGINEGAGDSGFIAMYTGYMSGAGDSGMILQETGLADSGASGAIQLTTGNSNSGNSGNISLTVGAAGGTQGAIKFLKSGVASVSGQVWTASSTDGTGYWAAASSPTNNKETFVLDSTNITNQYIDLAHVARTNSINFMVKGSGNLLEGASYDYSVSYTGGVGGNTRITFLNDLATGGGAALIVSDVVQVQYEY